MFKRAHHNRIRALLAALDADFLSRNSCFFGGGTAITLALDEYRESVDQAYRAAVASIGNRAHLAQCLAKMHMAPDLADQIPDLLGNAQ
jgi:hypothetical protein